MSSDVDPIESVTKGAVKGGLEWSSDFIKELANKFQNKELKFIRDEENIEVVKKQYDSGELQVYKSYIRDKRMLMILKLGLTLRRLHRDGKREMRQRLREDVMKKYEVKGLHVAQFVENGVLNRYIGILLDDIVSMDDFKKKINDILKNIEKYVLFVKSHNTKRHILEASLRITTSHLSMIFILSGMGQAADIIKESEEELVTILNEYELEKMSKGDKEVLFFKRTLIQNE